LLGDFGHPGKCGERSQLRKAEMKKKKTLKQEAIESLNRRAGQYNRHGKRGIAELLKSAADKLAGIAKKDDQKTWEKKDDE